MITFKVEKEDELLKAFEGVKKKLQDSIAFEALYVAVQPTVAAMESLAPSDTGKLRASIGVVIRRYAKRRAYRAIIGPRRGFGVGERDPSRYAKHVEFGHHLPTTKNPEWKNGVAKNPDVQPHPFMRPAWEETKGGIVDRMRAVMRERIDELGRAGKIKDYVSPGHKALRGFNLY